MNAYQIRLIAVLNQNRRDVVSEAAKPIGLAFWNSLTARIPDDHKSAVLDSMKIGLFLLGEFDEDLRMNELAFTPLYMERLIERLDWLEELFRPLCPAVANARGRQLSNPWNQPLIPVRTITWATLVMGCHTDLIKQMLIWSLIEYCYCYLLFQSPCTRLYNTHCWGSLSLFVSSFISIASAWKYTSIGLSVF